MENPPVPVSAEASVPVGTSVRATWQFSLDKVQESTQHYSVEERESLVALFRWCNDPRHPMAKPDAARRIGVSDNLLYKLYTGSYRNPEGELMKFPERLVTNIREFVKVEAERYDAGETKFVVTPTAKKVFTACDLARESQSPVIVYGPSHIGKTLALRHYTSANNHGRTFLVELDAASGLGGMVRKIATSCGISDKSNTAALIERIGNALTENTVLIVDEVHLLKHTYRKNSFFACIEVLRRIYDRCQCGMVLCWTNIDELKAASQGELIQLWRRGVHKIALPLMATKEDLGAILGHAGLQFPARDFKVTVKIGNRPMTDCPYEILRQLARSQGLKSITERLRYARKLSNRQNAPLSWESFVLAHLTIEDAATPKPEWT